MLKKSIFSLFIICVFCAGKRSGYHWQIPLFEFTSGYLLSMCLPKTYLKSQQCLMKSLPQVKLVIEIVTSCDHFMEQVDLMCKGHLD